MGFYSEVVYRSKAAADSNGNLPNRLSWPERLTDFKSGINALFPQSDSDVAKYRVSLYFLCKSMYVA